MQESGTGFQETDKPSLSSLAQPGGTSIDELQGVTSTDPIPWNLNHCLSFLPHGGSHPVGGTMPLFIHISS